MPIPRLESNPDGSNADLQDTTFLRDAVSRFVCNTLDEALAAAPGGFDVLVVGAGMYGAYYAAKVFQFTKQLPGVKPRILVLQEGPFLIHEHYQNLPFGLGDLFSVPLQPLVPAGQFRIVDTNGDAESNRVGANAFSPHHRCVGGKSLFWGGWAPELRDEDLAQWPSAVRDYLRSKDGYEFVAREIGSDYFDAEGNENDFIYGALYRLLLARARGLMPISVPAERFEIERTLQPPIAVRVDSELSGLFSPDKYSSLPGLIDAIREDIQTSGRSDQNRRLFLVPNVKVLSLTTMEGLVRGARVLERNPAAPGGPSERERSIDLPDRAYCVLAGNTLNSTRLARNSFPRPAQLTTERMGANLMVHVRGNYLWQVRKSVFVDFDPALPNELEQAALQVESTATLSGGRAARFHFQFYAAPNENGNAEAVLYQMQADRDDLVALGKELTDAEWVTFGIRTCGEHFGDQAAPMAPGGPRSGTASWIDTSPFNNDPNGVPQAFIQLVNTQDVNDIRQAQRAAAFRFVADLAGVTTAEAGKQQKDVDLGDPSVKIFLMNEHDRFDKTEDGLGTTYHECGTLWIGDDPESSVTDVDARFHHLGNTFVVDQSLFPTGGSANPVPTGLALARKAARALQRRFQEEPPPTDADAGFVDLFDGTLNGWQTSGFANFSLPPVPTGQPKVIEAGGPGIDSQLGLLRFIGRTFTNFVLRLEWKAFSARANAGVFLRTPDPTATGLSDAFYAASTEVQIDETAKNFVASRQPQAVFGGFRERTGAVYGHGAARVGVSKAIRPRFTPDGPWNTFEIVASGNSVKVTQNGQLVSAATVAAPALLSGYLGLQCHTEIVQFRRIRIRAT